MWNVWNLIILYVLERGREREGEGEGGRGREGGRERGREGGKREWVRFIPNLFASCVASYS